MRLIGKLFIQGLAAVLPLALTIYVLHWLATSGESLLGGLIERHLLGDAYVPGMGVALAFVAVLAVGLLTRAFILRKLFGLGERIIKKVPLVKTIYGSVKDLMSLFGDRKDSGMSQVVMVRIGDTGARMLGMITRDSAHHLTGRPEDESSVVVYLPMSYQIGGFMVVVSRESVEPVDMSVGDAMRLAVTAGATAGEGDGPQ